MQVHWFDFLRTHLHFWSEKKSKLFEIQLIFTDSFVLVFKLFCVKMGKVFQKNQKIDESQKSDIESAPGHRRREFC